MWIMQKKGLSRIVTTMTRGHQTDDAIAPTAQAVQSFELRLVAGGNHGSEACWLFRFAAFISKTRGTQDGSLKFQISFRPAFHLRIQDDSSRLTCADTAFLQCGGRLAILFPSIKHK
jgi:hypothetical protein